MKPPSTPDKGVLPLVKKKRINSRNKGHNYERELAIFFRDFFGFRLCKTSRQASRLIDDCGIDFTGLPFNVSAKTGYKSCRPKPELIFKNIRDKLKANFEVDDSIHERLTFLFHKLDGKAEEHHVVSMTFKHWCKIMHVYEKFKNFKDEK